HVVEQNLDAIRRLGAWPDESDKPLVLVPGAAAETRVAALMARHTLARGRFVIVHPGSRWQFKSWTAAANATLVDMLAADGWRVVLTAAPDPAERALTKAIRTVASASVVDLSGDLTLPELGALISAARRPIDDPRGPGAPARCVPRLWRQPVMNARAEAPDGAPQKLLVIELAGLGDNVHLLPALWLVRRQWPGAELHVMVNANVASLFKLTPWVDRLWSYPSAPKPGV